MKQKNSRVEKVQADLDIEEHIDMQEKGWRLQVIGMSVLFILVFTAAIGLYGDGLLSRKTIEQNSVRLEYQRFFRFETGMEIGIKASTSGDINVSFPGEYLSHFEITAVVPEQKASRFNKGRIEYVFDGGEDGEITFYLTPKDFGRIEGSVHVNDNKFSLNQFIFP